MKRALVLVGIFACVVTAARAQSGAFQKGTITKMQMNSCGTSSNRIVAALAGAPPTHTEQPCPEYTLISERVIYVVVGTNKNDLLPLAETIYFRLYRNVLSVRIDDSERESNFQVREMTLRNSRDHDTESGQNRLPAKAHAGVALPRVESE